MAGVSNSSFASIDEVKSDPLAVAVLLDIAYFSHRKVSELIEDLNITEDSKDLLWRLDRGGFIKPNPRREVPDIKYVLAAKGYFLLNELKLENPELLEPIKPTLN